MPIRHMCRCDRKNRGANCQRPVDLWLPSSIWQFLLRKGLEQRQTRHSTKWEATFDLKTSRNHFFAHNITIKTMTWSAWKYTASHTIRYEMRPKYFTQKNFGKKKSSSFIGSRWVLQSTLIVILWRFCDRNPLISVFPEYGHLKRHEKLGNHSQVTSARRATYRIATPKNTQSTSGWVEANSLWDVLKLSKKFKCELDSRYTDLRWSTE